MRKCVRCSCWAFKLMDLRRNGTAGFPVGILRALAFWSHTHTQFEICGSRNDDDWKEWKKKKTPNKFPNAFSMSKCVLCVYTLVLLNTQQ